MIDKAHASWSLGTYFFWPVFVLGLLLIALGLLLGFSLRDSDPLWGGVGLGLVVVIIASIFYWPVFNPSFHKWYPVNGTVQSTSTRLTSDGDKGVNQRVVIRFAENGDLFGCDDSRCTALQPGDRLNLRCKLEWQFPGTPGWQCQYVDS